jgi:hypothetical protein
MTNRTQSLTPTNLAMAMVQTLKLERLRELNHLDELSPEKREERRMVIRCELEALDVLERGVWPRPRRVA